MKVITLTRALAAPSCYVSPIGDTFYFPKDYTNPLNTAVPRLMLLLMPLPLESSAIPQLQTSSFDHKQQEMNTFGPIRSNYCRTA